jgi:hypothetical protein
MIIDLNEIPDLTLDLQIKIYSSGHLQDPTTRT